MFFLPSDQNVNGRQFKDLDEENNVMCKDSTTEASHDNSTENSGNKSTYTGCLQSIKSFFNCKNRVEPSTQN